MLQFRHDDEAEGFEGLDFVAAQIYSEQTGELDQTQVLEDVLVVV